MNYCAEFRPADGKPVFHLISDKQFTRHSEGAFLRLHDGRIMYAYSRFANGCQDDSPSHIAACYSSDEGQTWTTPQKILDPSDFGTHNIMSVSLLRMQNQDLGLFLGARRSPQDNATYLARSRDEGKTFYQIVSCTPEDRPGYYVLNNDRVIRLKNGRLIMPAAYHRGGYDTAHPGTVYFEWRSYLTFRISDDDGNTWRESADVIFPPFSRTRSGLQEPGIIELQSGVLYGYARTDKMYQYEFYSFDGGEHWTQAEPSPFTSPNSPLQMKRSPDGQSILAVWNPIPNYNGRKIYPGFDGRTPLACAISRDDGASWSSPMVIEGEEDCGYCYPAIFFTDDSHVLISYCSGIQASGNCLADSTIYRMKYTG